MLSAIARPQDPAIAQPAVAGPVAQPAVVSSPVGQSPSYGSAPAYGASNVNAPTNFNLIVPCPQIDQQFLYLTAGGRLYEEASCATTYTINNDQLCGVVTTQDTCGSPFVVGTEFANEPVTTMGLLPFQGAQSITNSFSLVQATSQTFGSQSVSYSLQWSHPSFTYGNGLASFAVSGVCGGSQASEASQAFTGMEVVAQTATQSESDCSSPVQLWALPAVAAA